MKKPLTVLAFIAFMYVIMYLSFYLASMNDIDVTQIPLPRNG